MVNNLFTLFVTFLKIVCIFYKVFVPLGMWVKEKSTGKWITVVIEPVAEKDYVHISKKRYFFNWKTEKFYSVYKLRRVDKGDILGLVSFEINHLEEWILVRLLAVSIENRGAAKKEYEGIAGNLIAYVCREAIKLFGHRACIALEPKTDLIKHYKTMYGMVEAGKRLALFGKELTVLTKKYLD